MTNLNKRTIDALDPSSDGKDRKIFDEELKGFGLRIHPNGKKVFFIQYRNLDGRTRRMNVGPLGKLTAEQARKQAKVIFGQIATGQDPLGERKQARLQSETLNELYAVWIVYQDDPTRSTRGLTESKRLLKTKILPRFGKKPWRRITPQQVQKLHLDLRDTPTEANRVISRLSSVLNFGQNHDPDPGWLNPTGTVRRYKESQRERFLRDDELNELAKVLRKAEVERTENPIAIAAIRMLIFTGARLREILHLQWAFVDPGRRILVLPKSKTGAKIIPIGEPAITVLESLPRLRGVPWVFPGGKKGRPLGNLWRCWNRLRTQASIPDVSLHDLRHTFASYAAGAGQSLPIIGAILGHRSVVTTQRYAHLANHPVREGVETTTREISKIMAPKEDEWDPEEGTDSGVEGGKVLQWRHKQAQ